MDKVNPKQTSESLSLFNFELKKHLRRKKLNVLQISKSIDVNYSYFQKIIKGQISVPLRIIPDIAKALGLTMSQEYGLVVKAMLSNGDLILSKRSNNVTEL